MEGEQIPEGLREDTEELGRLREREEFFEGTQGRDTMRAIGLLLTLVLLTACGTSRYVSGFDVEQFRSLGPGKTTKADVLILAGNPLMRIPGSDGMETWTYLRTEGKGFAVILPFYGYTESSTHQKTAVLTFRGEVLEKVEYRP
jgi:outer membrane protein assembly factor BamE (lipoprotein component of BamABCDE complex)